MCIICMLYIYLYVVQRVMKIGGTRSWRKPFALVKPSILLYIDIFSKLTLLRLYDWLFSQKIHYYISLTQLQISMNWKFESRLVKNIMELSTGFSNTILVISIAQNCLYSNAALVTSYYMYVQSVIGYTNLQLWVANYKIYNICLYFFLVVTNAKGFHIYFAVLETNKFFGFVYGLFLLNCLLYRGATRTIVWYRKKIQKLL